eukprot:938044-Amphidinium_carterae.1
MSRLDSLAKRLPGLRMSGPMAPSHQLIDVAANFLEEHALRHVGLHECSSREDELGGKKHHKEWKVDANGYVKEVLAKGADHAVDVSSEHK